MKKEIYLPNGARMRKRRLADVMFLNIQATVAAQVHSGETGYPVNVPPGQSAGVQLGALTMECQYFLDDLRSKTGEAFDTAIRECGETIIETLLEGCIQRGFIEPTEYRNYEKRKAERNPEPESLPAGADGDADPTERDV